MELTARQSQIHTWMLAYQHRHGYPPTVREIGEAVGIKSPNGVNCHVKALKKKGFATHGVRYLSRSVVAIDPNPHVCPHCGKSLQEGGEA